MHSQTHLTRRLPHTPPTSHAAYLTHRLPHTLPTSHAAYLTRCLPCVVLELEEVVEAVDAVVGPGTLTAVLIALRVTGAWRQGPHTHTHTHTHQTLGTTALKAFRFLSDGMEPTSDLISGVMHFDCTDLCLQTDVCGHVLVVKLILNDCLKYTSSIIKDKSTSLCSPLVPLTRTS